MGKEKISFVNRDLFRPKLYADLYIPSWTAGYSIAVEFIHNWFLSKFPNNFFKTVHVVGKSAFDDFRRFEYGEKTEGDRIKRIKPMLSIGSNIQFDFDSEMIDIHQLGIDAYIKKTDYHRSFFKDPARKMYLGLVPETLMINFVLRCRFNTRAQQLDAYKRMEIMFRVGCTETMDIDFDFHIPYELAHQLAHDAGYKTSNGSILEPYEFLKYLNKYSQVPFLYKLRYINGKHEFFIRMNNMPLYLDTRNKLDADDGEQEGQTSTNFHIDMPVSMKIPVPKFYIYYAEGKTINDLHISDSTDLNVYSMRIFDIPEINEKGWVQYATSNYEKDPNEEYVKTMDITELFKAPVNINVGVSLDDLIEDSLQAEVSPSSFIDIDVYTNDMMVKNGKLPVTIDWKNRTIILPDNIKNSYFYLVIYTELGYINSKIIDINGLYKNRVTRSKTVHVDASNDNFQYDPIGQEKE